MVWREIWCELTASQSNPPLGCSEWRCQRLPPKSLQWDAGVCWAMYVCIRECEKSHSVTTCSTLQCWSIMPPCCSVKQNKHRNTVQEGWDVSRGDLAFHTLFWYKLRLFRFQQRSVLFQITCWRWIFAFFSGKTQWWVFFGEAPPA